MESRQEHDHALSAAQVFFQATLQTQKSAMTKTVSQNFKLDQRLEIKYVKVRRSFRPGVPGRLAISFVEVEKEQEHERALHIV